MLTVKPMTVDVELVETETNVGMIAKTAME